MCVTYHQENTLRHVAPVDHVSLRVNFFIKRGKLRQKESFRTSKIEAALEDIVPTMLRCKYKRRYNSDPFRATRQQLFRLGSQCAARASPFSSPP